MDFDRRPMLVFWETTRACRLACRHCRAEAIPQALPGELDHAEGLRLIDSLLDFGERPPVLILTGGDVLMRADLEDLVAHARARGVPVALSPSVTPLLTRAAMRRLGDLGVRSVSISLDGADARTHERIRGVDGHFAQTIDALAMLREEGFTVQVNTTVMRENLEQLAEIALRLLALGIGTWEVFFLIQVGRGTELRETTPAENEAVAHFLFDASRHGLLVRTVEGPFFRRVAALRREMPAGLDPASALALDPCYSRLAARLREVLGEPGAVARVQTTGTRDGKGIIFVRYDGEVYPSGFLPLGLGNVRQRSLVEIYRDTPVLRAIRAASFGGRCGVCTFADLCGGSRARAWAAHGDPLAEDPACAYRPELARSA